MYLRGLLTVSAAIAAASCMGARVPAPAPQDHPIIAAIADSNEGKREFLPRSDDLLILTPSAQNLHPSEIALAVDGLAISVAEFEAGLRQFIEEHPGLPDPARVYRAQLLDELLLLAYVRDDLATREEDFRFRARAELRETIAGLVLERIVDTRVSVSEEEVRQRYLVDSSLWTQPPRVVVELILVATNAEAQALLRRIEAGEDFAELARVFSLHGSSQRGGRMEPFRRGTYSNSLEDVAFRLRPGETGTAETERGTFILRKIADSSEIVTPLNEVRGQIAETIRNEKEEAERTAFLKELKARYPSVEQVPGETAP